MPNMNDVKKRIEAALIERENEARGGYVNPDSKPYTVAGCPVVISRAAPTDRPVIVNSSFIHRDNMTKEEMNSLIISARSQATQIIQACNDLIDLSNALLDSLVEIENEVGHLYAKTL